MSGVIAFPFVVLMWLGVVFVGLWLLFKLLAGLGWAVSGVFRGLGLVLTRLFTFVRDEVSDVLRLVGGMLTALLYAPIITLNVVTGKWSSAQHYGQAMERELVASAHALYRVVIGNLARAFGLDQLTAGLEQRLPEAIARAPGGDRPSPRTGEFEGYKVVGSLPSGGSGARLWLAEVGPEKLRQLTAAGHALSKQVVIKSFTLGDGSTLPQIVRESRALEAARKLGLVYEHELTGRRFHYVMPYVPGHDLGIETARLHARAGDQGLEGKALDEALDHAGSLLAILQRFHGEGLWHKDVKPSNIIVSGDRVHLVDLGLLTPLQSAMTLTTHGTEYFRDPEMVRLALRGVKVNDVDGVKFDIYSAGAVLFSMLENSFPAHGSLSNITRRCPEALRWIVRRAMADIDHRYGSAAEMLADLQAVRAAEHPFKLTPASLPSVKGSPELAEALRAAAAVPVGPAAPRTTPAAWSEARTQKGERFTGFKLALGGLAAVVLLGFGAAVFMLGGSMRVVEHSSSRSHPDAPIQHASLGAGPESRFQTSRFVPSSQGRTRSLPASASPASKAAAAAVVLPAGADRRLLVINDLPANAPAAIVGKVTAIVDALRAAGFDVLDERGEEAADEPELALIAEARMAIQLGGPGDVESTVRVQAFLDEQGETVQGVLWFGAGAGPVSFPYLIEADDEALREQLDAFVRQVDAQA